ncbi:MAG: hypothetical protein BWY87_00929 [Deltaproteobacteria bacterium ADurb.Bin510]|nr:MAG: hypothetical protein BWY87_00929 [Deltaproteobacteria bacterium ADurb.Bin510]
MKTAEEIRTELKHEEHNETLDRLIDDIDTLLSDRKQFEGMEDIYAFMRLNTEAVLFLLKERRRDRKRREAELAAHAGEASIKGF